MKIAFCGTRGIPANYGGFETAVEEIARRLAAQGYTCEVFCRASAYREPKHEHHGCQLTYVPGSRIDKLDTFVSSLQTGLHLWRHRSDYDYVFWFNNANLPGILLTLAAGVPTAVNTDGLEWRRDKWSLPLKLYYFVASAVVARSCRTLISDSRALLSYYRHRFGARSTFVPYGAPSVLQPTAEQTRAVLAQYGLQAGRYALQITRIEPENLPLEVAEGFVASGLAAAGFKHLVIGFKKQTPYSLRLKALDGESVLVRPANYDPVALAVLRRHCAFYVHGNSVGGTNPALLEAMALCPRVLAIESPFSREVLGDLGEFFTVETLAEDLQRMAATPAQTAQLRQRVQTYYDWDAVAAAYLAIVRTGTARYAPRTATTPAALSQE